MTLQELLLNLPTLHELPQQRDALVSGIYCDSRHVSSGGVFVAVAGAGGHGSEFINDALAKGACCVVVEQGCRFEHHSGSVVEVEDIFGTFVKLLQRFYRLPSDEMSL